MEKKLFVNTSRPPPQQQAPLLTSLGSSPSNSNSNSMEYHNQQQQQVGMGLGLGDLNCFLNLNWDNSMMGVDDSALSSMVSSPLAPPCNSTNSLVIRELIGRLGSICNSGGDPQFNSNSTMLDLDHNSSHQNPSLDPGFYERAARYSQFNNIPTTRLDSGKISRVSSTQSLKAAAAAVSDRKLLSRSCTPDNAEFDDSSASASASASASEPNTNNNTSRKRKAVAKPKSKDLLLPSSATTSTKDSKATTKNDDDDDISNTKRCKATETDKEKVVEPPKDYIHVRARRGQATDSHSLAERVRREKISERMKFLQDLVPGCNKVTGKAVMLDEIINYVQSLQRQVEFLSMKLATVNPRMEVNMETLFSKDILQSHGSSPHAIHPTDSSASTFHYGHQPLQSGITNVTETHCSVNNPLEATQRLNLSMQLPPLDGFGDGDSQLATFWEDDLQSIVQMGFGQNQNLHGGTLATSHMKVEL